jgi:lipopolysaccharide transport system permease protein
MNSPNSRTNLLNYRNLFGQLIARDLKLKYRRSFLGYLWSVLNPLLMMFVMYVVFSNLFRFKIENYPVYLMSGQVMFNYMNEATSQAMFSVLWQRSLLKKHMCRAIFLPFPR